MKLRKTITRKKPFRSTVAVQGFRKTLPAKLQCKSIRGNLELAGALDLLAAAEGSTDEPKLTLHANTGKPMVLQGFEYPVIVDMSGVVFDKTTTPIIADHKTTMRIGHTIEQIILKAGQKGKLGGKVVVGPYIGAVGVRSSDMEIAKGIVADAKKGFPFQVSIGATIIKGYYLEEGDSAEINGKMWHGPLIVASRSRVRELTVTVLGADNDTTTIVATRKKETGMDFESWIESQNLVLADLSAEAVTALKATHVTLFAEPPVKPKQKTKKVKTKVAAGNVDDDDDDDGDDDPTPRRRQRTVRATYTADDINDLAAQNEERLDLIRATADKFSEIKEIEIEANGKKRKLSLSAFKAHAIRSDMTPETFELTLRRQSLPDLEAGGASIHVVDKNLDAKAIEASILRDFGVPDNQKNMVSGRSYGLESWYDDKTLEASHDRKYRIGGSVNRLLAMQVRAAGRHTSHLTDNGDLMGAALKAWTDMGGREMRAFSGSSGLDITNILENTMHKAALQGFEAVESVWREFVGVMSVNDFRIHNMYRLDMNGHFRKVPTDGELKHIGMTDSKYTVQADTYGAMIAVDRKTQINDDLGGVLTKARGIGTLGGMRIEELAFVTLLANGGSFFAAGNNNLITGGTTALSISSLETAQQKFSDHVINDRPIGVSPSRLLVGTNQRVNSNRLYTQSRMEVTTTANVPQFADNPMAGLYRPVVSGYLNNTSIKDQDGNAITGQSTTQWFLFPDPNLPQGSALVMAFLNGRQTPYIDEAETQFNIPGGIQLRAYFDFGAAFNVTQLALKSAGA